MLASNLFSLLMTKHTFWIKKTGHVFRCSLCIDYNKNTKHSHSINTHTHKASGLGTAFLGRKSFFFWCFICVFTTFAINLLYLYILVRGQWENLLCIMHMILQGVKFDPELPQAIRLEFAKSNTKVSKPKQQSPPAAALPTFLHPFTGRKSRGHAITACFHLMLFLCFWSVSYAWLFSIRLMSIQFCAFFQPNWSDL